MGRYLSAGVARYFRKKQVGKHIATKIKSRKSKKTKYSEEYRKAHGIGDNRYAINKAKDFNYAKDTMLPKHGSKKKRRFF